MRAAFVVLDCHLCNDMHDEQPDAVATLTPMAAQLVDALLARKSAVPQLQVLIIADPINGQYGSAPAPELAALQADGMQVVTADLAALRDRKRPCTRARGGCCSPGGIMRKSVTAG